MFARSTDLTVTTLRHYDEEGLLRPAVVGPASNYRYYFPSQMMDAERIRVMRGLEVPLNEIREYLREPDEELRRLTLLRHRRRVEQRITRDAHALEALNRMECAGLDPIAVTVKTLAAQPMAYTRYVTSLHTVEIDRRRAIERITTLVRGQSLMPGHSFSLCRDAPSDVPRDRDDVSAGSPNEASRWRSGFC
ncbi:MerR family transcriptional regulator [Deinococcus sp. QL22]|uniref:MerR family transcriptional regulator n=1 Tax=Deinococcus sp. QL22 TaxID=2939437 RepID=UPI002016C11E|nr:MerR family transcriptional regulator [Deinococcus sp. QL22]UQN08156.1 MerR family transcriptional regulator [Deinococcus sp. QL22]